MKRKLAMILIICLILSMLGGCGKRSDNVKTNTSEETDVIFYAYHSIPILNWDPSGELSNCVIVMNNIYETLLRFNAKTKKFENVLATDYESSEDGLVWNFKLREDVKFHDGTLFNAESVKYSIERTKKMGLGTSYIWDSVESINIINDYEVEFRLFYPAPVDIIASCPYSAFMMPTSIEDKPDNWFVEGNACGTGPYMLQDFSMGDEVILTKYDDYWKGWKEEHFEKAIIKKVSETSSRRQMIESGEADLVVELPPEDIEALKTSENVVVEIVPSFMNLMGFFNTQKKPLNDVKVRQALSYAVPYKDVVEYAMGGHAKQSYGAIPGGMWGHSKDLLQYNYDLNKSKQLLEEAGIKGGELQLLLTYTTGDEAQKKMAELYKAELSKIGVELEIRAMPWESQWDYARSTNPENRQDILLMYWWPDIATPYSWMRGLFHTEEPISLNLAYYSNLEFDRMINEAQNETAIDIEKAERKYIAAQKVLIEDVPAIFIYDKDVVWVKSKTLEGHVDNPSYPLVVFFYDCFRKK